MASTMKSTTIQQQAFRSRMLIVSKLKVSLNKNNLLLRGCTIRNTDYVEGIVVYAGKYLRWISKFRLNCGNQIMIGWDSNLQMDLKWYLQARQVVLGILLS